ncbi:MAG: ABC transporter permease [Tenericutes bacterium HGW-Tenericutes-1]|jgi:simple sugar transport system permease protein|nr:MAG: ABC transporter permease [Tenericutes bacterium HGW-Tenericutes-1]PKM57011.1 MAG: ABC transporter permease [Firmicutes bacterium HGW-Firmicutes-3]
MKYDKQALKQSGFKILSMIIPVLIAFAIGAIVILFAKENPLKIYFILFDRSFFRIQGLLKTLHYAGPLILAGLAIALSFKAGLFNMGIEGQIISAGFVVAVLGYLWQSLPSIVLIPLLLIIGTLVGVIVAILPAILKARYNVNEMVVTLLLNYAIIQVLEYLTSNVFRDPSSGYVSTNMIGQSAIMTRLFGSKLTMFFFVVVVVFVIFYYIFNRSKLGYEITAMGKNRFFAEATGMRIQRKIMIIMLTSGALAGLAGAGWMLSEKFSYTLDFSGTPGLGWDGMLIALLGSHSPIGILVAGIFYAILKTGSSNIAIFTNVPAEIIVLLQALIVLFLSLKMIIKAASKRASKRKEKN